MKIMSAAWGKTPLWYSLPMADWNNFCHWLSFFTFIYS